MDTQVSEAPPLSQRVFFERERAQDIFLSSRTLVIDGTAWEADMDALRAALIPNRRKFKAPFVSGPPGAALQAELMRLGAHADRLFTELYPDFKPGPRRDSWRPMITGPEPLHFDTYSMEWPMVTSFVNVSGAARVYCLGPSLEELVSGERELMRRIYRDECSGKADNLSFRLRRRTDDGRAPLGSEALRARAEFAPGAIWFFSAKTVSHEVVYGEGAMSFSWPLLNSSKPLQADICKALT